MKRWKRKGLGHIGLIVLAVLLIVVAAVHLRGNQTLAIFNTFDFAGFSFSDFGHQETAGCNFGGAGTTAAVEGEALVLTSGGTMGNSRTVRTEVTGVDEVLVIYDGYMRASCTKYNGGGSASGSASIVGFESGSVSQSISASCNINDRLSEEKSFPTAVWKFKNNFDGTWSALRSLGAGDLWAVESKQALIGDRQYLEFTVSGGVGGCQGSQNQASGYAKLRVLNIVRKENAVALCKADEVSADLDRNGKLEAGECVNLQTLKLEAEEAIRESDSEKLARLEEEQQQKVAGLEAEIAKLQKANEDATAKIEEMKEAKSVLNSIQAHDSNIINTIEANEQFTKPSLAKRFWNAIVVFFKNIFN